MSDIESRNVPRDRDQPFVHTPGPWKVVVNGMDTGTVVAGNPGNRVTIRQHNPGNCVTRVAVDANARLIAASPDLLECVAAMLVDYEQGRTPDYGLREMCREAIARVKGEAYE